MKIFILLLSGIIPLSISAQVGIGAPIPHSSAKLEVRATDKGFLMPRVSLTNTGDVSTIASPAEGLMVYNNATAGTSPTNVTPGNYYYSEGKWKRMDTPSGTSWYLSGTTTDAGSNKTGNIYRSGAVSIGNPSPAGTLELGSTDGTVSGYMIVNPETAASGGGNEGGQIILKKAVSGSNHDWIIDQFNDAGGAYKRLRIFSTGGEVKGLAIMESGNISLNPTGGNLSSQTEKVKVNGSSRFTGNLNAKGEDYVAAGQATNMYAWSAKGDFALPMTDISGQDPNNWWQGDPDYRFLPTIPGYYFIQAQVNWAYSASDVALRIKLQKNSTEIAVSEDVSNTNVSTTQKVSAIVYMNGTTDYVKLLVYSGSASLSHTITGNQSYTKLEAFKIN